MPARSVQTCVTSPPYYALRDYSGDPFVWGGDPLCEHVWGDEIPGDSRGGSGTPTDKNNRGEGYGRNATRGRFCRRCSGWRGALGLEPTCELFVKHLVLIFREVRRVLRDDGTLWLNIGDSFSPSDVPESRIKAKDLVGIPWMVAFALRDDGWYLRSDVIWAKGNPMPEPVLDRPTRAHEYLFLLTKSERYYYDADAIREAWADDRCGAAGGQDKVVKGRNSKIKGTRLTRRPTEAPQTTGRNARTVWTISGGSFPGAHFAVFPPELPKRCILAGSSAHGACATCGAPWAHDDDLKWLPTCDCIEEVKPCLVLDPFSGSATTGEMALQNGRSYLGIEQNPEYVKLGSARLTGASRSDLKSGDLLFCPGCQEVGVVKMFSRQAVNVAKEEGRKITCPKCMRRYTPDELESFVPQGK